jgi:aspartyl-tRNA(Asn)/glutamyl-tRNA(Gln) amidotransferase subunit A
VDIEEWAEPSTRRAFRAAIDALRGLGVKMAEARLREFPYGAVAGMIISAEGSAVFEPLIRSGQVDQLADKKQIAGLRAGLEIAARDYLKAMRIRSLVRKEMRKLFSQVDILVSPACFDLAPKTSDPIGSGYTPKPEPKDRGLTDLGAAGNLAGLPALALPCGFAGNLPVGIQLVGRPFSENNLITLGKAYQERTDWHRRRPPLA